MIQIVLIVGASGVGKDTLLKNIQNRVELNFIKRYITREPDRNEHNYYVDNIAFDRLKDDDFFISTWEAHHNKYGIARNQIINGINLISISRGAIKDFENSFDNVTTIEITLPRDILYRRLKNRARESEEEIQKRLNRSYQKIEAKDILQFDNSEEIEVSTEKFITLLERIKNEANI
jgi:phosphonate metabolism protein PhnN/1,5-bisphosphokinase (PRPP-forming)